MHKCSKKNFAHFRHVKCDLAQNSCSTVRRHMSIYHFLSVLLQCHVDCCHSLNVCRTHHWKLRCKPGGQTCPKHPESIISSTFPIHRALTFLAVSQREYPESLTCASNRVHLRQTSLRCRSVWCPSFFGLFAAVTFTDFCQFGFRLP